MATEVNKPLSPTVRKAPPMPKARTDAPANEAAANNAAPANNAPANNAPANNAPANNAPANNAPSNNAPVSTAEAIRDARRVVGYLRAATSAQNRVFERRPLLRSWQASMSTGRLDAAIKLLEAETLLTAVEKTGGQQYEVALAVYRA